MVSLTMKNLTKIFLIIFLFFITAHLSHAQVKADSSMVKQRGKEASQGSANGNGNAYGRNAAGQNMQENRGIKQVRGARPDMSKARGARPPDIERPSGSRIPKGMGKPGGAVKHPGR